MLLAKFEKVYTANTKKLQHIYKEEKILYIKTVQINNT